MKNRLALIGLVGLVSLVGFAAQAHAQFLGPTCNPPNCGGLFNVDANRNIGFGTTNPTPTSTFDNVGGGGGEGHGYVFLVASTSNPGIGLRNTGIGHMYLWSVRNIGSQSRIDLYREGGGLPGKILFSVDQLGNVGISAAPTSTYRLIVEGNIYASGTLSSANPISGSLSAANVTGPSAFGANYGTYNYAVPGAFAVGTTTTSGLPTEGLYVKGSVGIGTISPLYRFHVASSTAGALARFNIGGSTQELDIANVNGSTGLTTTGYLELNATQNIHFRPGGSQKVVFATSGNVGIGTTGPQAKLTVQGVATTGGLFAVEYTDGSDWFTIGEESGLVKFNSQGGRTEVGGSGNLGARFNIGSLSAASIPLAISGVSSQTGDLLRVDTFGTGGNQFIIKASGNVGIATTTPSDELTVFGDIRISKSGSALIFPDGTSQTTAGTGVTAWTKSGATVYVTDTADSVGIGTTSPDANLQVRGSFVSGNTYSGQVTIGSHSYFKQTGVNPVSINIGGGQWETRIGFDVRKADGTILQNAVLIDPNGNVGVATTTPAEKLSVVGGGIFYGATGNVSAGVFYDRSNSAYYLDPAANENAYSLTVAGSVGIGTTGPNEALHVYGTDKKARIERVTDITNDGRSTLYLQHTTNGDMTDGFGTGFNFVIKDNAGVANEIANIWGIRDGADSTGAIVFNAGGIGIANAKMIIKASGNVGIGTTNPQQLLHLSASGVPYLLMERTGASRMWGWSINAAGHYALQNGDTYANLIASTPVLFIQQGGNVGIATTTPSDELTVFGDIRISKSGSALIFPDGTSQTTASVGYGYFTLSGTNLYPTSTTYKVAVGSAVATSSLSVVGDTTLYGASGNISAGVYYDRTNTAYYLDPGANENAYSLTTAGNVGVGTTTPAFRLTVAGSGNQYIWLQAGSAASFVAEGSSGTWYFGSGVNGPAGFNISNSSAANATNIFISNATGNVGVATTTPGYKLTVAGTSYFGNQITLASGVQIAATNNTNSISMAGGNITGVGKLTVTTIDPLYSIKGRKYSTYAASIAGGVKEEYVGQAKLVRKSEIRNPKSETNPKSENPSRFEFRNSDFELAEPTYEYIINFDDVAVGSDLWVWRKTVDFSNDTVQVMATPAKIPVPIAYEISGNKIIFRANAAVEFSYRLIGNRFDWRDWPTYAKDQNERPSLIVK